MPSPSFWPLIVAGGLAIVAYGVVYAWALVFAGALIFAFGAFGWALEPSSEG